MKGAIAGFCAKTIKPIRRNKLTTIGTSHQRFVQKNENNSPTMPTLLAALLMNFIRVAYCSPVANCAHSTDEDHISSRAVSS